MFDRILKRMRERVQTRQYVMTLHAEEEMDEEGLTVYDVESGILTGKVIERQRDRISAERKYLLTGETLDGEEITVVAKIGPTGKLVILTVYGEGKEKNHDLRYLRERRGAYASRKQKLRKRG
jgi:hypothetical protein